MLYSNYQLYCFLIFLTLGSDTYQTTLMSRSSNQNSAAMYSTSFLAQSHKQPVTNFSMFKIFSLNSQTIIRWQQLPLLALSIVN